MAACHLQTAGDHRSYDCSCPGGRIGLGDYHRLEVSIETSTRANGERSQGSAFLYYRVIYFCLSCFDCRLHVNVRRRDQVQTAHSFSSARFVADSGRGVWDMVTQSAPRCGCCVYPSTTRTLYIQTSDHAEYLGKE